MCAFSGFDWSFHGGSYEGFHRTSAATSFEAKKDFFFSGYVMASHVIFPILERALIEAKKRL